MAGAGDLEKLPLELRCEIYALTLVKPDGVSLINYTNLYQQYPRRQRDHQAYDEVAPAGHHRKPKHRNQKRNPETKKWETAPSDVGLIFLNKKISKEAAPILYGCNKFTFQNINTLSRFLKSINADLKQHICHISVQGLRWRTGRAEARRSLGALGNTINLRTLEVPHGQICIGQLSLDELFEMCKPLLSSLKASYSAQNLARSVVDVIKIELPRCVQDLNAKDIQETPQGRPWYAGIAGRYARHDRCQCSLSKITKKNDELVQQLRKKIADMFGSA